MINKAEWNAISKLCLVLHGLGLFAVYCYSIYLGFCSSFFKGCFMLLLIGFAQLWLFFEEWMCSPFGFSSSYVTFVFCVILLAVLQVFCRQLANIPCQPAHKRQRIVYVALVFVVLFVGYWRYKSVGRGATSPEDVACAYAIAAKKIDVEMARYYSDRARRDQFDSIERAFYENKTQLKELRKSIEKKTENISFRAARTFEDRVRGRINIMLEIVRDGDSVASDSFVLERQDGDWKVVDGGGFAEQWDNTAAIFKNQK